MTLRKFLCNGMLDDWTRNREGPKISYLIFGVESHDASLVSADDGLARFDDGRAGFVLEFVGDKEQQEAALQQVDSKEEWHEAEVRVVIEDVIDSLGGSYGMRRGGDEALRGDPEVVVVEQRDRVPFAVQQDVQGVHEMGTVSDDDLGLKHGLGDTFGRIAGSDRVH